MDCDQIDEAEIVERYVAGRLDQVETVDFELHFLGCKRCFERVRLLQDMQAVLSRRPGTNARWWTVLAVAASLLVAAGATWLRLRPVSQRQGQGVTAARAPVPARLAPSLAELAMVSPPRYQRPQWRSASPAGFDLAIERYAKGDYAGAAPGLLAAVKADPGNTAASFFLGICYLMQNRNDEAISQLKATIASGDSPELEEAHFYLSKAFLRKQDVSGAAAELRRAIALRGPRQAEEQSLLESVMEVHPAP